MNEAGAIIKLQGIANTVIADWSAKLKHKINPVRVIWSCSFNIGGEFDSDANTITLNKEAFQTLGFYRTERILRHELAHVICWTVYRNQTHDKQFAEINRRLDGADRDD